MICIASNEDLDGVMKGNPVSTAQAQQLLDHVAELVGLPALELDDEGFCSLLFDDRMAVNISYAADAELLTLYCNLGEIAADQAERVYPLLLEANVLWAGTGGATLGVTPADRCVILAFQDRIKDVDPARFETLLEGIFDMAEFWLGRIEQSAQAAEEAPAEEIVPPNLRV